MGHYTDDDERTNEVGKQEEVRFAWIKKKLASGDCLFCERKATNTRNGSPVCWLHEEGQSAEGPPLK